MDGRDRREVGFEGWMRLEVLFLWVTWSGYVVWPGAQGADPVPVPYGAKSPPRKDSKMQRKRTGPGAPRAGPSPRNGNL